MYALVIPLIDWGLDKRSLLVTKPKMSVHSNDKEGFIRAFTDEWVDLQMEYSIVMEFTVEPSNRKGVLRLCATALSPQNGHTGLARAYYQVEYPTAAVQSLEAALFSCMVKLERILRERRLHPSGKA